MDQLGGWPHLGVWGLGVGIICLHFFKRGGEEALDFLRFSNIDQHIRGKIYHGCCMFKNVMKTVTSDRPPSVNFDI